MPNKLFFLISILAFLPASVIISQSKTVNINKDRFSWYEKYIDNPAVQDEMEYMDDQLLGETRQKALIQGIIQNQEDRYPIDKAKIQLLSQDYELLAETTSSRKGFYRFPQKKFNSSMVFIKVKAKGFASLTKAIDLSSPLAGIDFPLQPAASLSLNKNETKSLTDLTGHALLSVNANALIRLDQKPIQFPITISLSYIDPLKNLSAMPGHQMLTEEPQGITRVLTSIGALNIEATDNQGMPVRLDPRKIGKSETTSLKIRLGNFMKKGKLPSQILPWSVDPDRKQKSWRKSNLKAELPSDVLSTKSSKEVTEVFLIQYAQDVAARINSARNGSYNYCPRGSSPQSTSNFSFELRRSATKNEIFQELLRIMSHDIYQLSGNQDNITYGCLSAESPDDNYYGLFPERIFHLKADNKLQPADSYRCENDSYRYFPTPYSLTKGFDYSPLLKLKDKICATLEENRWKNAVLLKNVDLIPFNLDKPYPGIPIEFQIKEKSGDGKFLVKVKMDTAYGIYENQELLNSGHDFATFHLLSPDGNPITLEIFAAYGSKGPIIKKTYRLPKSQSLYKWNEKRTQLLDNKGNPVRWRLLDKIIF